MADLYQFYPTPQTLAQKALAKFKHPIQRLLEPSAGRGDLLAPLGLDETLPRHLRSRRVALADIDCIELDLGKQAVLRDKGYTVIGHDFLRYSGASVYSHVLMNPPFAQGAEHVLHAWDILYSGELVAILNAETLRNPYTAKRRFLLSLVEQYSATEPEFLEAAFLTEDTERATPVEVVIIHLEKNRSFKAEFLDSLREEYEREAKPEDVQFGGHELILPKDWITNQVTAFNLAVKAMREAALAEVRADYYAGPLGRSILEWDRSNGQTAEATAAKKINEGYRSLKERAWSSVLRGTEVTKRLSSGAQKRIEAEFKKICSLEFTVENIFGFLGGLIQSQGDIQIEMLCDVFDAFSRFHHGNHVYYQGWKSNTKHRQLGLALRASRIVIPACRRDWYGTHSRSLSWDDAQAFRDFDKAFALLDGKHHDTIFGIEALFNASMADLAQGGRGSSDYFDVRFYPKAGTFHLFPRRKDLVERLNRLVGKQRQWLPPEDCATGEAFWQQYAQAEKINKEAGNLELGWRGRHGTEAEQVKAQEDIAQRLEGAARKLGMEYDPDRLLAASTFAQLPLLAA